MSINISGVVENVPMQTNVYTPIIEAIVNAIQAIEDAGRNGDGEVTVIFKRSSQATLGIDEASPEISDIEIIDNGIGFTQENRDSFDELYSDFKKEKYGCKGFGRFMFLKYFESIEIESVFHEDNKYLRRKFDFKKGKKIINPETESVTDSAETDTKTAIKLKDLKEGTLDKKLSTIARKILEKLLIYFIRDDYKCPKIILKEEDGETIVLNDYLTNEDQMAIKEVSSQEFELENSERESKEKFQIKIFKIFFPHHQKSRISLTADNREVTSALLHHYVPEFEDDFYEEFKTEKDGTTKKDYFIKSYVLGDYLNNNVTLERESFKFSEKNTELFFPFTKEEIEKEAARITQEFFGDDIKVRKDKKRARINEYVATESPWHSKYLDDLNIDMIPYNASNEIIETELHKAKLNQEQKNKLQVKQILENESGEIPDTIGSLMKSITESGESDLAHYVCNRKAILDLLERLLKRNDDGSAKYEEDVHNVIFPMGKDNHSINYEDHNLWLLDERLVFSQYIASDKKISSKTSPTEPDLVVFDQKRAFRQGDNEFSNPLTIFEFKRPKRTNYDQKDDPILQVGNYIEEIRAGKYETPEGVEKIKVNDCTPVYAFVVCDIVDKIKDFAKQHQLVLSPDQEGYFGFHTGYKMYIEIISFKKLMKDAKLRNKIFFHKLGIE